MIRRDFVAFAEDSCPGDDVAELADVSRPVVLLENLHGFGGNFRGLFFVAFGLSGNEVFGQNRDVFSPFSERGRLEQAGAQVIVERRMKFPFVHERFEVAVDRANDADIRVDGFCSTEAGEGTILQEKEL